MKSGSEEKKLMSKTHRFLRFICVLFFFTDVRKPGLHNVIMYLSIVGQPDMWVWLRSFILFLNQCNLHAVQYPPPPFQASVTFHFYSSWTNCCWAWFLISACPNPLTCIVSVLMIDLPVCKLMWEWALKLGWVFLRFCTKKNEIAHALLLIHSIQMNCVISLLKNKKQQICISLSCACLPFSW